MFVAPGYFSTGGNTMALTEAQIDTVFVILELPRSSTVEMPVGRMGLTGQTFQESNSEFKLQVKIESRLSTLSANQLTKLVEYVDFWDATGIQTWTLSGSVGGLDGINQDPSSDLARVQERVRRLIGVYQIMDQIQMEKNDNNGFIPVLN